MSIKYGFLEVADEKVGRHEVAVNVTKKVGGGTKLWIMQLK